MKVTIDTSITTPGPFTTDKEYCQFVMAYAALSYQAQYGTDTPDAGIAAARQAYNDSLPPAPAPDASPASVPT
jgi:hypothetical protein